MNRSSLSLLPLHDVPTRPEVTLPRNSPSQARPVLRATQACNQCRKKKVKCDENKPKCGYCCRHILQCKYKEVQTTKVKERQCWVESFHAVETKVDRVIQLLQVQSKGARATSTPQPHVQHDSGKVAAASRDWKDGVPEDALTETTLPRGSSSASTFTAVQSILQWPSIKQLLPKSSGNYDITKMEEERGRVWSYGFGVWSTEENGVMTSSSFTESPLGKRKVAQNQMPHSSAAFSMREGQAFSETMNRNPSQTAPGHLADSVDHYFECYRKHLHTQHPIVDESTMISLAERLKQQHRHPNGSSPSTVFSNAMKRKRGDDDPPNWSYATIRNQSTRPPRTEPFGPEPMISDALTLLILALGHICAYRQLRDGLASSVSSKFPGHRCQNTPDPISESSLHSKLTETTGSNQELGDWTNGTASTIPGQAYYTSAAEILGRYQGGHHITLVQAYLLAGLYMGQLAQVFASHAWISQACRICQVLITS